MTLQATHIIILITSLISFRAFKDNNLRNRFLFEPYRVKHRNQWEGLLGHMFLHADITHLLFNMLSLYFLGSIIEFEMIAAYGFVKGEIQFLIIYFIGGLFSTLIPFMRHQNNPNYRSLGASGAVSSVIFATILWRPDIELMLFFIPIPIPAYVFGPLYLAFEYWADKRGQSGIAHDAHIGGALFGIFYVLIINIDKGKEFINYLIA
jgi:membrane associated rhomboid family serine protease